MNFLFHLERIPVTYQSFKQLFSYFAKKKKKLSSIKLSTLPPQ